MKIIIAPDSFKGSLRSPAVCAALARGLAARLPEAELVSLPLADGGEGTVDAVVAAAGGTCRSVRVRGPLMEPVEAVYGLAGARRTAVIEMAAAAGLELLPSHRLDPGRATTCGVGELLRDALDAGCREIILGIGGSATVDGGAGLLQALGLRLLDKEGGTLPAGIGGGALHLVAAVDASDLEPRLREISLSIACDVTNPLLGPTGAAAVFAPQKGADPATVARLEENLAHWSRLLVAAGLADRTDHPGDGAAGGLGFALRTLCGGRMTSGAQLIIEAVGLPAQLANADLVITGEGRTDGQTAGGKLCAVVTELARAAGVPTVLLSGALAGGEELDRHFSAAFSIARGPGPLAAAMADTEVNLEAAGRNLAGLLKAVKLDRSC